MLIKDVLPKVQTHGRIFYDDERKALFCNWSCSGLSIKIKGKSLRVKVRAWSDQIPGMPGMPTPPPDWPCIGAVIDDELTYRHECKELPETGEWLTLWESDTEVEKVIRVVKISENSRGKLGILEIETDGEVLEYKPAKRPTIEIVGDSITCGFGNEAPDNAFEFKTVEENGWKAYGARAARELGYEFSIISESGISAAKPEHPMFPMHAMEDIYGLRDELCDKKFNKEPVQWNFKEHKNDIVVINLGTNDANPIRFYREFGEIEGMEQWFKTRYKEFIKQVRTCNGPDTYICCTLGPMDQYLYYIIREAVSELVAETGDVRLITFQYVSINVMMEGYGAAGHPSLKTHARMGKELAAYIRKYIGEL